MRIVTGGIAQETNTFQWQPTTLEDFARPGFGGLYRRHEILDLEGADTIYGGAVVEAKRLGVELIPTTFGSVMPGERVSRHTFNALRDEMVAGIKDTLPDDCVFLDLRSAMPLEVAVGKIGCQYSAGSGRT